MVLTAPLQLRRLPAPAVRHARRGEFDLMNGSYRQYNSADLLDLVYKVRDKQLKTTELAKLYNDGAIHVSNKAVEKILYPKSERAEKIAKLEANGLVALGSPRQAGHAHTPLYCVFIHTQVTPPHRCLQRTRRTSPSRCASKWLFSCARSQPPRSHDGHRSRQWPMARTRAPRTCAVGLRRS